MPRKRMAVTAPKVQREGEIPGYYNVSPSQIKLWLDGCKRKWGLKYVANMRKVEGEDSPAAFGKRTHSLLEEYQKTGVAWDHQTPEGKVAAKALQFLPAPHRDSLTEKEFNFDTSRTGDSRPAYEGRALLWNGFRDLTHPPAGGVPMVTDYKTCGNLKYALTEVTILQDPQAILYTMVTMAEYGTDTCDAQWLYLPRNVATPKEVRVRFTKEHVKKEFRKLEILAREIERTHANTEDAMALPYDSTVCDKYSGCEYKATCNLSPIERQGILMGFLDDLKARKAAEVSQVSAPVAAAAPPSLPGVTFNKTWTDPAPVKINPPEAPNLEVRQAVKTPEAIDPVEAISAASGDPLPPPAPTVPAVPEARKRTRRTKDQIAADNAAALAKSDTMNGLPEYEPSLPLETLDPPSSHSDFLFEQGFDAGKKNVFTLYVDCAPRWQHTEVDRYIARVKTQINLAFNVDDYRAVDFAKGRAALANETAKQVQADIDSYELSDLVVYTNSPEGQEVLSSLVALANGRVVRA